MTEQEIDKQKIEELQKQLDELKKAKVEETKKKWIPEVGEYYYYIATDVSVEDTCFDNMDIDKRMLASGNCFETKEQAQFVADKIKYTVMFKNYVEEHSEPLACEDDEHKKWYISYNHNKYASSEQILKDAINYIGEDNVKKYILEVED